MTLQEIILENDLLFGCFIFLWAFIIFAFYQSFKEK